LFDLSLCLGEADERILRRCSLTLVTLAYDSCQITNDNQFDALSDEAAPDRLQVGVMVEHEGALL